MQTNKRHNLSATLPLHAALSRPSNKVPATKVLTASLPFICQRFLALAQDADLCSLWHPDCLLAAPGGVLWLRSCDVFCPRSAAGPSKGC